VKTALIIVALVAQATAFNLRQFHSGSTVLTPVVPIVPGPPCTTTIAAGANVATALSAMASGGTLCLGAGSYAAVDATFTKTAMTFVRPSAGVAATAVNIAGVDVNNSQYVTFQDMTIAGATVSTGSLSSLHITFSGIIFTNPVCINNPTNINQDTLITFSTFIGVGVGCNEGRVGVNGNNISHSVASGIVISYNVFGPGGCSDGVQITGGARGVQVLYNEFVGLKQASCSPVHLDPIQFYGAPAPIITGNYFHGNSTGIMSPDCNGSNGVYTNNVFVTDGEYPDQIVQSGSNAGTYNHNTFNNGARIRLGNPNACGLATNVTLTNNIISAGLSLTNGQTTATFTVNFNHGIGGTNPIAGTPTYTGGTTPSTWAGFLLTALSPGKAAGSDGFDIGALYYGGP
jgi:hypothetical protein